MNMTIQQLYNFIDTCYGTRGCWISDLAKALHITHEQARCLTVKAVFFRGKKIQNNYVNFTQSKEVGNILIKINNQ